MRRHCLEQEVTAAASYMAGREACRNLTTPMANRGFLLRRCTLVSVRTSIAARSIVSTIVVMDSCRATPRMWL